MKVNKCLRVLCIISLFFISLYGTNFSYGQEWPSKPIHIIVGWAAGGNTDIVTRALARNVEKDFGVPVIVENKTGGAGLIALGYVAKAKPDGYTLASIIGSAITEKPFLMEVPFDPIHEFSWICAVYDTNHGFVVRSDAPWKTFQEFVEAAKKQPGKLTVSPMAYGGTAHVGWGKLEQKIPGLTVTIVPSKGGMESTMSLLGGHVDAAIPVMEWKPYADAGKLRLLAACGRKRIKGYENIPTLQEMYGVYIEAASAYSAPNALPEEIRAKLEKSFKKAAADPAVKSYIEKFALTENFRSGKEIYEELMKGHLENKEIIPKLGISLK